MFPDLLKAFVMLFVVMNSFGGIPVFLSLTRDMTRKEMRHSADKAAIVAGAIILLFAFLGMELLGFFSVSMESFQIAGGLILLIIGVAFVLDIRLSTNHHEYTHDITVPVATPLIAGPGVLTTVIILLSTQGLNITIAAALLNLLLYWLLMHFSNHLYNVLGKQGSEMISRIMGLIVASVAVEFIIGGITPLVA
ncbi:MAG: MarC family protein [Candidatus Woesearchaeota archaeon]